MKFILLVEGRTEREAAAPFLKRWLDDRLTQPVGIQPVTFTGYEKLAREMVTKARMYLDGPRAFDLVGVVALMDLYGPDFYPISTTNAAARVDWGKKHFEQRVSRDKFRMFFAVHEFEAWLLSQPSIFPNSIATALDSYSTTPERVNFDLHPSKLLNREYRRSLKRDYKKTTYGKQLFRKLDPTVAVSKCPYLQQMLDEMLQMAKAAGL